MIKVAIHGATGYTGFELVRLLIKHPAVELVALTSRKYAGSRIDEVFPALKGDCSLVCENVTPLVLGKKADIVFTALPHEASMKAVPDILTGGAKVVDLSADFRFRDEKVYAEWYQPHSASELLLEAVYGLPELYRDAIRGSRLVGNPGCYPTSVILAMAPLVRDQLIDLGTIIADSKSGVSGAGRGLNLATQFCEANEGFKAYKVGEHRHTPEMEQELSSLAKKPVQISFTPHLVPMTRGILSTIYASLKPEVTPEKISESFHKFYRKAPFIRLLGSDTYPNTLYVRGTNYCDIGWKVDTRVNRVVVVSAIDNLTRGASGQAVCNMNLMSGLDEETGLKNSVWQP